MIRLFAAVVPPPEIAAALIHRQQGLPGARWRPVEAFHVTLRFFGEIDEARADDLDAELGRVRGAPFELALAGAGAFDEGGEPRAVWAGVEANPALDQLARRCESAARRAGLAPDRHAYRAHLTLAYLRRALPNEVAVWVQQHALLRSPPFRIDRFGLYSSHLGGEGASYRLERDYPL